MGGIFRMRDLCGYLGVRSIKTASCKIIMEFASKVDSKIFEFVLIQLKELKSSNEISREIQKDIFGFIKRENLSIDQDYVRWCIEHNNPEILLKEISNEIYQTAFQKIDLIIRRNIKINIQLLRKYDGANREIVYKSLGDIYKIAGLTAQKFDNNMSIEENVSVVLNNYNFHLLSINHVAILAVDYLKQMGYKTKKIKNKALYKEIQEKIRKLK